LNDMPLEYQHPVEWEEVFGNWRNDEAVQPSWQACAKKKGWPDWDSWRMNMANQLELDKREWHLFKVVQPLVTIPGMLVGPFKSWQDKLPTEKRNKTTFEEYLDLESARLAQNEKILEIIHRFPSKTQLIGLADVNNRKAICLEGTHRSIAVTACRKHGFALPSQVDVRIALAKLEDSDCVILDRISRVGSENPNNQSEALIAQG
jgi:hypothetical protein